MRLSSGSKNSLLPSAPIGSGLQPAVRALPLRLGTILLREIKQNHLDIPSERNLAGFYRLGLGLPFNYTFLQAKKKNSLLPSARIGPGLRPTARAAPLRFGAIFSREIERNRLQLPSDRTIAGFYWLRLGLASNYGFRLNKKVTCFRRLGLGVAFNQLSERFRFDPEQFLDGKSNKIIYSFLKNKI